MHSIDGVLVTGKTVAEIQDVVIGEVGTKVMVAVLRSDALPEDLELDLHQFERWRPVVLVRSLPRPQHEIQQQNGSLYSSQQSVRSMQNYGSNGSTRKSVWPMRYGREVIAVDLVLDEDYRVVAPTVADKASFTAQITNDISTALRVPRRFLWWTCCWEVLSLWLSSCMPATTWVLRIQRTSPWTLCGRLPTTAVLSDRVYHAGGLNMPVRA